MIPGLPSDRLLEDVNVHSYVRHYHGKAIPVVRYSREGNAAIPGLPEQSVVPGGGSAVNPRVAGARIVGTKAKPVDVGGDVNKAAELLAQGQHVQLDQPDEVATLLERLAVIAADAKAKGEAAPDYDLCKVSVPGTNLFCAESKGIPRIKMPQLKGVPAPGSPASKKKADPDGEVDITDDFVAHLKKKGIAIEDDTMQSSHLRATQSELNGAKVAKIMSKWDPARAGGATLISGDNYIVDGHHRWAAQVGVDAEDGKLGDEKQDVRKIQMPITDLLAEANTYAAENGIAPQSAANAPNAPKTQSIGVTPFRGKGAAKGEDYFQTARYKGFEAALPDIATEHGVTFEGIERGRGVWDGGGEPAVQLKVSGEPDAVQGFMDDVGARFQQDAVIAFAEADSGPDYRYRSVATVGASDDEIEAAIAKVNADRGADVQIQGAYRTADGHLEIIDAGDTAAEAIVALADELDIDLVYHSGSANLRFAGSDYQKAQRAGRSQHEFPLAASEADCGCGGHTGNGRAPPPREAEVVGIPGLG